MFYEQENPRKKKEIEENYINTFNTLNLRFSC